MLNPTPRLDLPVYARRRGSIMGINSAPTPIISGGSFLPLADVSTSAHWNQFTVWFENAQPGQVVELTPAFSITVSADNNAVTNFAIYNHVGAVAALPQGAAQGALGVTSWQMPAGTTGGGYSRAVPPVPVQIRVDADDIDPVVGGARYSIYAQNARAAGTATIQNNPTLTLASPSMVIGDGPFVRHPGTILLTDSQSYFILPADYPVHALAAGTLIANGHLVNIGTSSVGGASIADRTGFPFAIKGMAIPWQQAIGLQWGGFDEIESGSTPAATYAAQVTRAAALRATSLCDYVIGFTLPPNGVMDPGDEANRVTYNGLLLADASGAFDAVIDIEGAGGLLANPASAAYQVDQLHLSAVGAALIRDLLVPVLEPLMV